MQNDELLANFSNPDVIARYTQGPPRYMPGYADMQRMTGVLLAEKIPEDAQVLVLGAGGGLELKVFAETYPGWSFDGVDPAPDMLGLARQTLGPLSSRVRLHEGYIDDAPEGPFDAATCLLTLHFLAPEERRRTMEEIRRRLKPGAPFVAAHSSFPQSEAERPIWLSRYAAFAVASGADPEEVEGARGAVERSLNTLTPEEDEALLEAAGFSDIELFYAAFTWRGWLAAA
ncbi:class I SAM-dependent methyltransferase [Tepidicaulis sp.]|uniref:class I SAM-dependent methyltransferase n=1 Tax=Tepidicaulis sp. TaxID=1920809 RepID=UPI003B5A7DFE